MNNNKVAEINLENGNPTISAALQNMKNALTTNKGQGYKAIIIIHGYGSSGVGGSIKAAIGVCLCENSLRGIVKAFVGGENWLNKKRDMLSLCGSLEKYERKISGNQGVTVVVFR